MNLGRVLLCEAEQGLHSCHSGHAKAKHAAPPERECLDFYLCPCSTDLALLISVDKHSTGLPSCMASKQSASAGHETTAPGTNALWLPCTLHPGCEQSVKDSTAPVCAARKVPMTAPCMREQTGTDWHSAHTSFAQIPAIVYTMHVKNLPSVSLSARAPLRESSLATEAEPQHTTCCIPAIGTRSLLLRSKRNFEC